MIYFYKSDDPPSQSLPALVAPCSFPTRESDEAVARSPQAAADVFGVGGSRSLPGVPRSAFSKDRDRAAETCPRLAAIRVGGAPPAEAARRRRPPAVSGQEGVHALHNVFPVAERVRLTMVTTERDPVPLYPRAFSTKLKA